MGDAIQMYVDKDDSTAIKEYVRDFRYAELWKLMLLTFRYVAKSLTSILHDVAAKEVHEDDVDDAVSGSWVLSILEQLVKRHVSARSCEGCSRGPVQSQSGEACQGTILRHLH